MKEKIIKALTKLRDLAKKEHEIYANGLDLTNFLEDYNFVVQYLFDCIFTDEAIELIYWWLYDNVQHKLYEEGQPDIDLEEVDIFVEYLFSNPADYIK